MSHPLLFDFPISSVFFMYQLDGAQPLGRKKTRCVGITEAYIDTVLSSKEFITSAQNAHGFLLAENGKVWVMFFGGANRGATNTLGVGLNCGWVWCFSLLTSRILRF